MIPAPDIRLNRDAESDLAKGSCQSTDQTHKRCIRPLITGWRPQRANPPSKAYGRDKEKMQAGGEELGYWITEQERTSLAAWWLTCIVLAGYNRKRRGLSEPIRRKPTCSAYAIPRVHHHHQVVVKQASEINPADQLPAMSTEQSDHGRWQHRPQYKQPNRRQNLYVSKIGRDRA